MNKTIYAIAAVLLIIPVMSSAKDKEERTIEKMDKDTWFTGSASYPDELSPALTPLLHCELRSAGTTVTMGGERMEGADTESECNQLRQAAVLEVEEALIKAGISNEAERKRIAQRAFGAVDALAASQRIWRAANQ
ncbi:MAG: hypothetical protein ABJO05_09875 [Roseibium sp.]